MNENDIKDLVSAQRTYFNSGATRVRGFRKAQLIKLRDAMLASEKDILAALYADLGKSDFEAFAIELVPALEEFKLMIRNCEKWSRDERRPAGLFSFPSKARIIRDPHGVCLIMSPWNYPFQLTIAPLIGAIAAGNTAIIKPSAYAPATSRAFAKLVSENFPREYIAVVEGGRDVNGSLLEQKFDHIFFTGSVEVGKLVMASASKNLTPVTLELGGKSPCIVDKTADLRITAHRTVWGKLINAGQTCVAPDYFLVHESIKDAFIEAIRLEIARAYGDTPHLNPEFPTIINDRHFARLNALIAGARHVTGGRSDAKTRKIEPAIITGVSWDDTVMKEELFGPIIPIIRWTDEDEIIEKILARPRPLALYIFTGDRAQAQRIMHRIPFGGGCVNDTIMHVGTNTVPFGGTGDSGMGAYHGKDSFLTFSRAKPVISSATWLDVPLRYAPFAGKFKKFRRFF